MNSPPDHVVFDFAAKALACRHCGAFQPVAMPISVTVLVAMTDAYLKLHERCRYGQPPPPRPHFTAPLPGSETWPHVLAFAFRMEAKLEANRHKGNREGWLEDSPTTLFRRLEEETRELLKELNRSDRTAESTANEAADVANFAMMIADVVGGGL